MAIRIFEDLRRDAESGSVSWNEQRLVIMPVAALCEIQKGLEPQGQRFAAELIAFAGFTAGGALAERIRTERDPESAAAMFCRAAGELGLGAFRVLRLDRGASLLEVEIRASPFASAFSPADGPSCPYLRGFVTALAEQLFGVGVAGEETACAAAGASACRVQARSVAVSEEGGWSW